MEMTNDSFYMSAPTSPRRISLEMGGLCFFSVPTSPTKRTLKAAYEDSSSNGDEFEFETSRRFNVGEREVEWKQNHEHDSQPEEPLPDMAFADELFYDGKVVPLKPPPGLQYHHKQSSSLSPTRSPGSGLRFPFQRRSLWNDDFDPFMAALKNVKKDKADKSQGKNHRRARSMSPFREEETNGHMVPTKQPNSDKNTESKEQAKERQLKLSEPKGVVFARQVRLVNVGNGTQPREASVTIGKQPTKGQKMKKLLFSSGSMSNENQGTWSANGTEARPKLKRKFSFKAMGIAPYKEEKRVSDTQATLAALIQYRPKLLLCMGYGAKYVK